MTSVTISAWWKELRIEFKKGKCMRVLILGIAFILQPVSQTGGVSSSLSVSLKKIEDRSEVLEESKRTIVSLQSPSGIGHGELHRTRDRWPEELVVRLRIRGLESLKIIADAQALGASVSSQSGEGQSWKMRTRLWRSDNENTALDEKSPLWIRIRAFDANGRASESIPLEEGYFELLLPIALLAANPKSIKLHWIDFYR
jgi:hypothetical protein